MWIQSVVLLVACQAPPADRAATTDTSDPPVSTEVDETPPFGPFAAPQRPTWRRAPTPRAHPSPSGRTA